MINRVARSWRFLSVIAITAAFIAIFCRQLQAHKDTQGNWMLYGAVSLFCLGWLLSFWRKSRLEKSQRRTELVLQDREALLHAIMDGGKHAIIVADRHQVIKSFNRASERLYGYNAAHFVGRPLGELGRELHIEAEFEEEAKRLSLEFGRTVRPDEIFELPLQKYGFYEHEWTVIRGDETRISIRLSISIIRDENGEIHGYLGIAQDVTAGKMMEGEIKSRDILLNAVMDGGKHGILMTDRNRKITVFNRAAERLSGFDAAQVVGRDVGDFLPEVYVLSQLEGEAARLSLESGSRVDLDGLFLFALKKYGVYEREWTVIRRDGIRIPILLTVTSIQDAGGENHGSIGIFQDISERKAFERIKSEFISTASHELRTPLTSIRGALGLVATGTLGPLPEKAAEALAVAYKNCERLVLIINDILDVEKIESGKLVIHVQSVEVAEIMRQALEANRNYGEKYGVRLVLKGVPMDARASADPDRLMQVMANLLSNAAKFSLPGTEVWVGAEQRDDRVYFWVRDFGIGIPGEFQERVFQKFAQADHSDARRSEGTGLGLSIARKLMEAMHGSIRFETEVGEGTTFFFDLPQA